MPLQVEYRTTLEELVAFNEYMLRAKWGRRFQVTTWLPPAALLVTIVALSFKSAEPSLLLSLAIAAAVWPIMYRFFSRRAVRSFVEAMAKGDASRSVLCQHRVILEDDACLEVTEVSENRTRWEAVERIEHDRVHLYVFVGPGLAHIIPKSSFADAGALDAFMKEAERLRAAHRP